MTPSDGLVPVYFANSELEGVSIRDLLLHNGIPAILRDAGGNSGFISVYMGSMLWRGEVLVNESDLEKAEELVCGFLGTLGMLEEADLPEEVE